MKNSIYLEYNCYTNRNNPMLILFFTYILSEVEIFTNGNKMKYFINKEKHTNECNFYSDLKKFGFENVGIAPKYNSVKPLEDTNINSENNICFQCLECYNNNVNFMNFVEKRIDVIPKTIEYNTVKNSLKTQYKYIVFSTKTISVDKILYLKYKNEYFIPLSILNSPKLTEIDVPLKFKLYKLTKVIEKEYKIDFNVYDDLSNKLNKSIEPEMKDIDLYLLDIKNLTGIDREDKSRISLNYNYNPKTSSFSTGIYISVAMVLEMLILYRILLVKLRIL